MFSFNDYRKNVVDPNAARLGKPRDPAGQLVKEGAHTAPVEPPSTFPWGWVLGFASVGALVWYFKFRK